MIEVLKEYCDEGNILVRMYRNTMSKSNPITVQMLDDDCGEIVESTRCPNMVLAEKTYNRYLFGDQSAISVAI